MKNEVVPEADRLLNDILEMQTKYEFCNESSIHLFVIGSLSARYPALKCLVPAIHCCLSCGQTECDPGSDCIPF